LWRHVSNVPEILGTLETCRHNPVTRNRPKLNHALCHHVAQNYLLVRIQLAAKNGNCSESLGESQQRVAQVIH